MLKKKAFASLAIILVATLILAACQQATPVAPTLDANAIYTQAAATVAAGLAQTQQAQPSPTTQPPTPTNTMEVPTASVAQPGPGNETPTVTPTGLVFTPIPTNTQASVAQPSTGDKAELVSQSPADNTVVGKSDVVTVKFVMKNVGTTTWTTAYTFRYYAGDKMGSPNDLNLTKTVAPNETVEIILPLTAPSSAGNTNTIWVLTNAQGVNFSSVFLILVVQ